MAAVSGVYAAGTDVTADRSRSEIERTLQRYGATSFMYGWEPNRAALAFAVEGRQVRFELPLPDRTSPEFTRTSSGKQARTPKAASEAYDQAVRQRWRALALVIKAKLEAVAAGIVTFDDEFLAHLVLPNGSTVAQELAPRLALAYESGTVPALLPAP